MYLTEANVIGKARSATRVQQVTVDSWVKTVRKFTAGINPPEYFKGLPVGPNFEFFYFLANLKEFPALKLQIPTTIVCLESGNYSILHSTREGVVRLKDRVKYNEFQRLVKQRRAEDIQYLKELDLKQKLVSKLDQEGPSIQFLRSEECVDIVCQQKYGQVTALRSSYSSKSALELSSSKQLHQQYVRPLGFRANLIRVHYKTKFSKETGGCSGYRAYNRGDVFCYDQKKKMYTSQKLFISTDERESFELTVLMGKSLSQFSETAEEVLAMLQKHLHFRVTSLVLDFVVNLQKFPILVNLKSFNVQRDLVKIPRAIKDVDTEFLSCSVLCKMCGIFFKTGQCNNLVTYKLIFQFAQHLKKRGGVLPPINISLKNTKPCRVCDLCYKLLVAEQELIDVENQFARAQNLPVGTDIPRIPVKGAASSHYQWRLMVYLMEVKNLQVQRSHNNLQYQFLNERTSFSLGSPVINRLRVHYFFSSKPDINQFLQNQQLTFRITEAGWQSLQGEGMSHTLRNFHSRHECQRHFNSVMIFFKNAEYCCLETYVGLICDGYYNTEYFGLRQDPSGIFIPPEGYFNCNPIPDEWMEVLAPRELAILEEEKQAESILQKIQMTRRPKTVKEQRVKELTIPSQKLEDFTSDSSLMRQVLSSERKR